MECLPRHFTNLPIGTEVFSLSVRRPHSHGPWQLKSSVASTVCFSIQRHRYRTYSRNFDDKDVNDELDDTQYFSLGEHRDLQDERRKNKNSPTALLGLTWLQIAKQKFKGWKDFDLKVLRSRGLAGTLAYGFLNSIYYGLGIIFVWTFISQVPKGLSLNEFTQSLVRVAAYTWAGSQVTKSVRIISAVALAEHVDELIDRTANALYTTHKVVFFMYTLSCFLFVVMCVAILASVWTT